VSATRPSGSDPIRSGVKRSLTSSRTTSGVPPRYPADQPAHLPGDPQHRRPLDTSIQPVTSRPRPSAFLSCCVSCATMLPMRFKSTLAT
jgi:hypothetical protein